jgi:hypothetical protein
MPRSPRSPSSWGSIFCLGAPLHLLDADTLTLEVPLQVGQQFKLLSSRQRRDDGLQDRSDGHVLDLPDISCSQSRRRTVRTLISEL